MSEVRQSVWKQSGKENVSEEVVVMYLKKWILVGILLVLVIVQGVIAGSYTIYANHDAYMQSITTANSTWQTLRDSVGFGAVDNQTGSWLVYLVADTGTDGYNQMK